MSDVGGLDRFGPRLHPAVVEDIRSWTGDPELSKLCAGLEGHTRLKSFLDTYAEALVARHLLGRGCRISFEVPTPGGRACDFGVQVQGQSFFLHVKRLDTERPARKRLTISSRLRALERIDRPYLVKVRWQEGASDEQMLRLVRSATDFILHARVGDELVVHDESGQEIGGVLLVAPWEGTHVSLVIALPSGFIDEAPRIRRLLRRAHRQFMPRAANVILVCSSQTDEYEDFKSALLGSHIERWDTYPQRGRRIAHGRAADGIWHDRRYADSRIAGWFRLALNEDRLQVRLHFREEMEVEPELGATLGRLFGDGGE